MKSSDPYNYLLSKAVAEFNITDDLSNVRLRGYKPNTDSMLDTFTGKEDKRLDELKIGHYRNLCIEIKSGEFEEYCNLSQ